MAKFCFWELPGIFFLTFLICSWLNPWIWKANCTQDTYYYHKKFKEKNKGGDYYRRKTKNLHKVIVDHMQMKGRRGERQEELKLYLTNPQEVATVHHSQPAQHSQQAPSCTCRQADLCLARVPTWQLPEGRCCVLGIFFPKGSAQPGTWKVLGKCSINEKKGINNKWASSA